MADETDDSSALGLKIPQSLIDRDENRISAINKKKEEKTAPSIHELADCITRQFMEGNDQMGLKINAADDIPPSQLGQYFDALTKDLLTLQKYLADSMPVLPSYDLRRCQEALKVLEENLQTTTERLVPKKKFAFKSKKRETEKPVAQTISGCKDADKECSPAADSPPPCGFTDVSGQTLSMTQDDISNKDVILSRLDDCTVHLYGNPSTVHATHLTNCRVLIGPVTTSVFVEACHGCTFQVACQQMRVHTSKYCTFLLHVTSRAIIEDSHDVRFGPYSWRYEQLDEHYRISGLNRATNNWRLVDDFNWLVSDKQSPNWRLLDDESIQSFVHDSR
jgi:hypothetical protein